MPVVLTPFTGMVARAGGECGKYGDPYEWCCCVSVHGESAVIEAVDRRPTKQVREDLRAALAGLGIKNVLWVRKRPGKLDHIAGPFEVGQ